MVSMWMAVGILAGCDEQAGTRGAAPPAAKPDAVAQPDDAPPLVQSIRKAEANYRVFMEKHEAAHSASRARRELPTDVSAEVASLAAKREEEALAARAKAAEARIADWKEIQLHNASPFERKQVAAYRDRYELREEIRLATLAADLYATDPAHQDDYEVAQQRLAHYREKLADEDAAWALIDKGGWRETVAVVHP